MECDDTRPQEERRDELLGHVYGDLKRLAASYLRHERSDHSMSVTDLVHEAYGRLAAQTRVEWQSQSHYFAISAQAMRRILVDHARRRARLRHGGDLVRVPFETVCIGPKRTGLSPEELIDLDQALASLAEIDPRQAQVVEMRTFAGMSIPDIASVLGVSSRSVDRDWTHAKSWLRRAQSEQS